MEPNKQVTAAIFSAFIKCPTKAYLLASCEHKLDAYFAEMSTRISSAYKNITCRKVLLGSWRGVICHFEQLLRNQEGENKHYHVDCETAVYDLLRTKRAGSGRHVLSGNTIPILFVPWEKPDSSDILLICFGALALAQVVTKMPTSGTLIYGDELSLEVSFQRTFGKLECALPEFKKINDAAYWDYQRSKVYARTDKTIRRSVRQTNDKRKISRTEGGDDRRCTECMPIVQFGIPSGAPRGGLHCL